MKAMLLFFIIVFFTAYCYSQERRTYVYDSKGNIIGGTNFQLAKGATITLVDSATGNKFALDSMHITVTAFNKNGDTLWVTDPWKDNQLMEYRVKRPVIVSFKFRKSMYTADEEIIYIVYNNTQFGAIHKATGRFEWFGQD